MLVLLDKDGTLIRPKSGHTFVQSPGDQELLPGAEERIYEFQGLKASLVVVSNQAGVDAGHKTLKEAIAEMEYLMYLLPPIKSCYFCPDFEGKECFHVYSVIPEEGFEIERCHEKFTTLPSRVGRYRKPESGMLIEAVINSGYRGSEGNCLMIGDRPEDVGAAEKAGIRFIDAAVWRLDGVLT